MGNLDIEEPNSGVKFRSPRAAALFLLVAASLSLGACADLAWPRAGGSPAGLSSTAQAVETDYERGKRELTSGRLGLAARHFLAALDQEPKSVEALNGLGAAFDRLGRFDLSARAYGRALAVDPDSVQTLNNMGYSFYLQGRYDLAVAYLRDASSRAEAGALTRGNHRLAIEALARAGGPPPRSPELTPASVDLAHTPYLRRAGKALRDLITRQPESVGSRPGPASPYADLLPAFVAAPMAIAGARTGSPALGSARTPRAESRLPSN